MKAYNSPSKRECYGTPSLTARRLLHYRRSLIPAFFPSQGEKCFLHNRIQNQSVCGITRLHGQKSSRAVQRVRYKEKGAETPPHQSNRNRRQPISLEGVLQGHAPRAMFSFCFVNRLTPDALFEVEVDVTDFNGQGQILVDLVLGDRGSLPGPVSHRSGGQTTRSTRTPTMTTHHFGGIKVP